MRICSKFQIGNSLNKMEKFLRVAFAGLLTMLFVFPAGIRADVDQPPIELPALDEVVCTSYIVVNRTKGETLIENEKDKKIYPASMTKIMTVGLALEYLDTEDFVTVSQTAMDATTPNSTMMGLKVGEQIKVSELIYGAMLPSGNDAANVLGESVVLAYQEQTGESVTSATTETGSDVTGEDSLISQFATLMNEKAASLGLVNTHFMNTSGLHHDSHYTTAADLAVIFNYALGFDEFRKVINSPSHVFQATNMHTFDGWSISRNTNYLLNDPWILGDDSSVVQVVGGKTGTTIVAGTGMTLLAVNKNGDEMITVVCGIPYDSANRQTTFVAAVLNAGAQACFEADPVVRVEGNVMDYMPKNAPGVLTPEIIQPSDPGETIQTEPTELTATEPVPTGTVAVQEDPEESFSLFSYLKENPIIAGLAILVVLFVIAIILLVIIPAIVRRKRMKKRKTGFQGIRRI